MNADAFLARYEGLRAALPGDDAPRAAAAALLRQHGLPHVGQEGWRYTNLRPLSELPFREPLLEVGDDTDAADAEWAAMLPALDMPRLVFANGRFRPALSRAPDEVGVRGFGETGPEDRTRPDRETLVALNAMLAEDGATLEVAEGVDGGSVMLASLGRALPEGHPVAFHPRHRITLAPGAKLTLFEVAAGEGTTLHNPVFEIAVAPGAALTHVRLQEEDGSAFHLSTTYADVAEGGSYDSFLLTLGARLARCEIHARLHGPGAAAHLNGAQLLGGSQHADFTTVVAHDAPRCVSRQTVKNVLDGRARGVFQGRIEVARAAQKTDGYQMNQALLLSPHAEIDSKPQLEIYADDVRCSHGATVGELDAEQLFYLRSRGLPGDQARALLVRAFLAEALDQIADPAIRAVLDARIERAWSMRDPARETQEAS